MKKTWLDTETKAILHRSPPAKRAPSDTTAFALVLLAAPRGNTERLAAAVERIRGGTRDDALRVLRRRLPTPVKRSLSYEDALLGQFDLIACDAVSVFLSDDVVRCGSKSYLAELFADLCESPEFRTVTIRIESMPGDAQGRDFLDRFTGAAAPELPLELPVMRKKARIMDHWAAKIGGRVVLGGEKPGR